jgi:hypothetical protein
MFTVTVEQDPADEPSPEEIYQALGLLLLPRASALWEAWVASGRLTVEEAGGERRWRLNGAQEEVDDGVRGGSK